MDGRNPREPGLADRKAKPLSWLSSNSAVTAGLVWLNNELFPTSKLVGCFLSTFPGL